MACRTLLASLPPVRRRAEEVAIKNCTVTTDMLQTVCHKQDIPALLVPTGHVSDVASMASLR